MKDYNCILCLYYSTFLKQIQARMEHSQCFRQHFIFEDKKELDISSSLFKILIFPNHRLSVCDNSTRINLGLPSLPAEEACRRTSPTFLIGPS